MTEYVYVSTICMFGFNFLPSGGWVQCNGALMSIAQNQAVFALVGTTYGGNGMTTFGVPDLRGRSPIGFDQGPGLSNFEWGQQGGVETVTLSAAQIPIHTHTITNTLTATLKASTQAGTTITPGNTMVPAALPTIGAGVNTFPVNGYIIGTSANTSLLPAEVTGSSIANPAGGGQPHENRSPYLAINFCMAVTGEFPSRN